MLLVQLAFRNVGARIARTTAVTARPRSICCFVVQRWTSSAFMTTCHGRSRLSAKRTSGGGPGEPGGSTGDLAGASSGPPEEALRAEGEHERDQHDREDER